MNEVEVQQILSEFDINPVMFWEIILRQCYDKIFKVDDETILYNINFVKEFPFFAKDLIKVIHLVKKNLLIVLTDHEGDNDFMQLMQQQFKFVKLDMLSPRRSRELTKTQSGNVRKIFSNDKLAEHNDDNHIISEKPSSEESDDSQFIKNLSKKFKASRYESFITCDDIIFALLESSLSRIEPGILSFEKEA